ncbi:hypothetical protein [Caballeronia sp. ATUFL_M2_KS44]|uniref:hypothetical protein n=1 Tax=Caballeronia sp. ATUFL_M2_KS44 TaxID=2921767 RepID=UPI002027E9F1|nr:hypothetical protein [Caballeronia sp. ATUFL_M2_KS44]
MDITHAMSIGDSLRRAMRQATSLKKLLTPGNSRMRAMRFLSLADDRQRVTACLSEEDRHCNVLGVFRATHGACLDFAILAIEKIQLAAMDTVDDHDRYSRLHHHL